MPTNGNAKRKAGKPRKAKSAARTKTAKKRAGRPVKTGTVKNSRAKHSEPSAGCCKDINLSKWDMRVVEWKGKPFYAVRYGTFFHIPIGMGKVMTEGMKTLASKYGTPYPELWLSQDTGLFSARMLFAVSRAKEGDPAIERMSGRFVTRGFRGPYNNMGNFIRVFMEQAVQKHGKKPEELYFWYANCPKCAKKQGGPKTIIFGRI